MYSYMIDTNREGAYASLFDHAAEHILKRDPKVIAECAGVRFDESASAFIFESLGQPFRVSYPGCGVSFAETGETPCWEWHLVILHYLADADGVPLSGELMPFRMLQSGIAYKDGFEKKNADTLVRHIANKPVANIKEACLALGGRIIKNNADVCAVFDLMPRFPVTIQIWITDEEMEGSGNVLFDGRASHYLTTEGAETAGSLIVDFLVKQYEVMFP